MAQRRCRAPFCLPAGLVTAAFPTAQPGKGDRHPWPHVFSHDPMPPFSGWLPLVVAKVLETAKASQIHPCKGTPNTTLCSSWGCWCLPGCKGSAASSQFGHGGSGPPALLPSLRVSRWPSLPGQAHFTGEAACVILVCHQALPSSPAAAGAAVAGPAPEPGVSSPVRALRLRSPHPAALGPGFPPYTGRAKGAVETQTAWPCGLQAPWLSLLGSLPAQPAARWRHGPS